MIPKHKTTIMVHCLDTPKGWRFEADAEKAMKEVTRWHVTERGWRAVAYAMLIDTLGNRAKGRDLDRDGDVWEETGAGAKGWNKNTIHIALTGGKGGSKNDSFDRHFTPEQDAELRAVIAEIQKEAGRPLDVIGHNQVANKACPCFDVPSWYEKPQQKPATQSPFSAIIAAILAMFGGRK